MKKYIPIIIGTTLLVTSILSLSFAMVVRDMTTNAHYCKVKKEMH